MKKLMSLLVSIMLFMILPLNSSFASQSNELFEFMGISWDSYLNDREQVLKDAGLEMDDNFEVHAPLTMFGLAIDEISFRYDKIYVNFVGITERISDNKFATFNDAVNLSQQVMDGCIDLFGQPDQIVLDRLLNVERKIVNTTDMNELFTPINFFGVDTVCVIAKFNNVELNLMIEFGTYGVKNSIQLIYYDEPVSLHVDEIAFTDAHLPTPTPYAIDSVQ